MRQPDMMALDMEPTKAQVPDRYQGEVPPWYQVPELTERPDWTELRPPYHPDSALEHRWSVALTPVRFALLALLWLTYTWYRAALAVGNLVLLYIIFISR